MARNTTMLDLVNAVAEHACSDAEIVATVVYLINSGTVRLCGTFEGVSFDLREFHDVRSIGSRAA
jgi:hypothetical protein